jgi:blocked-early-in-transport protein 1
MTSNGSGYTRTAMDVEGQNDERLEGLLGKVKILKDVSGFYESIGGKC